MEKKIKEIREIERELKTIEKMIIEEYDLSGSPILEKVLVTLYEIKEKVGKLED